VGKGILARLVLERRLSGVGNFQILSSSRVLANDGKGTDLMYESVYKFIEIQ
jgi:hypothetical protein